MCVERAGMSKFSLLIPLVAMVDAAHKRMRVCRLWELELCGCACRLGYLMRFGGMCGRGGRGRAGGTCVQVMDIVSAGVNGICVQTCMSGDSGRKGRRA